MKKVYLFLFASLVSVPFWLGINLLQKQAQGFFAQKNRSLDILTAQIHNSPQQTEIATTSDSCFLNNVSSKSFLILQINPNKPNKILLEKSITSQMPIASLTKLMTYLIAGEFYKNEQKVVILNGPTENSTSNQLWANGILKQGDVFSVQELISIMLVESNNEAAFALTKVIGQEGFLDLMNMKAKELGLVNTKFYNSIGVDPEALQMPLDQTNYSTAFDLALLAKYLVFNHPDFLSIISQKEYPVYKNGQLVWTLQNTNELLGEIPEIIGGKTGTTDKAGECLMEIIKMPQENDYLIAIVLNSKNRFDDMRMLLFCSQEKIYENGIY
ncbi:MAG: serine hydrolase [Candidatus Pacebacteria bacterium]|nr:serine hydrolase [Candidatus Paceibacterota bacterium]